MDTLLEAFRMVAAPDVLIAILASSIYGVVVGSLPGLSATMATALLVPVTFYLSPLAAVASIVAASAMAIFSGDIPGCLLRIPGTPASAAYTDEAYAMTRKGQADLALGAGLWFSAIGGVGEARMRAFAARHGRWLTLDEKESAKRSIGSRSTAGWRCCSHASCRPCAP